MSGKEGHAYPRNAPCPCNSGLKYKGCCYMKGFEWRINSAGETFREVPMSDEVADLLRAQREKFIARHGREPGPDDPVFEPEDIPPEDEIVRVMREVGISERLIFAHKQTGLIVTEENHHLIPEADLAAWDAAIETFDAMN